MTVEKEQGTDTRPSLATPRLTLRPFTTDDVAAVHRTCSDREIARNTLRIEHPYPDGAALHWIKQHPDLWLKGEAAVFAICVTESSQFVGAMGLEISEDHQNAELGYWIDRSHWGNGYCTEAAAAVIVFAFEQLALHRVHAHYMTRNPASGRVMEKVGMTKEGLLRKHVRKWGVFEDVAFYGILATDPRPAV